MPTTTKKSARPSQELVAISEIRDGIVILINKGLRVILMASSINFALKSSDEQEALISQYQNFLNSLDFSMQFFIQSRKLNIEPYLDTLRERIKIETNELLKIQTAEYLQFIKKFVESESIVSKTFYVVVPYNPVATASGGGSGGGILDKIMGSVAKSSATTIDQEKFEEQRSQLFQRVDMVQQGLLRMGVRAVPLNTEEIIELFYGLYNPGEAEKGFTPHELNVDKKTNKKNGVI